MSNVISLANRRNEIKAEAMRRERAEKKSKEAQTFQEQMEDLRAIMDDPSFKVIDGVLKHLSPWFTFLAIDELDVSACDDATLRQLALERVGEKLVDHPWFKQENMRKYHERIVTSYWQLDFKRYLDAIAKWHSPSFSAKREALEQGVSAMTIYRQRKRAKNGESLRNKKRTTKPRAYRQNGAVERLAAKHGVSRETIYYRIRNGHITEEEISAA